MNKYIHIYILMRSLAKVDYRGAAAPNKFDLK